MKSLLILFTLITSFNIFSQSFNDCRPRPFEVGDKVIHGGSNIGAFDGVVKVVEINSTNKFIRLSSRMLSSKKSFFPQDLFCLYRPIEFSSSLMVGMTAMKYATNHGVGRKVSIASLNSGGMIGINESQLAGVLGAKYYKNGSPYKFVPYKSIERYKGFRVGGHVVENIASDKRANSQKKYEVLDITKEGYILINKLSRDFYVPHSELTPSEPAISYSMAYDDLICDMRSGQSFFIDKFVVEEVKSTGSLQVKFEVENSLVWGFDSESQWIELSKDRVTKSVLNSMRLGEKISLIVLADIFNDLLKDSSLQEKDRDLQIISCYPKREKISSAVNDEDRKSSYKKDSFQEDKTTPKARPTSTKK